MKKALPFFIFIIMAIQVIGGNWISLTSQSSKPANVNLISSDITRSRLHISLPGFYLSPVATSRGEAQLVTIANSTSIQEKGAPDLPKLTASVIIPDQAAMQVKVLSMEYRDFPGILVAPSKGVIIRDTDPSSVPYEFGPAYGTDQFFPAVACDMREPYIIRDLRGQTIIAYPFRYNPVTRVLRVYYDITLEICPSDGPAINPIISANPEKRVPQDFVPVLQRQFLNFNAPDYPVLDENGKLLVICHGPFMEAIRPYVNWKVSEGYQTTLISKDSVGSTAAAIKSFIANYYNTNGLTHVLLVGDAPQIPTNTGGGLGGPSDNAYGYIVGNDHYADVFIGRFSAETAYHVTTQVQRTLDYEKNPQFPDSNWYTSVIGIASDQGPGDDGEMDYEHIRNQQSQLLAYNYTWNPEFFDGSQGGNDAPGNPTPAMVVTEVNKGSGLILYTGHGSKTSWGSSGFSNTNVNQLTNTGMLPFIWSVACVNGEFMSGSPCFAEAWLRANKDSVPTGAIAFLGSTINQSWDSPMEGQDEMTDILAESYPGNIKRTFAGISINGCMKMIDSYGTDGRNMADTWTVFGDPTIMVRTARPEAMTVTHDASIMVGSDSFLVTCEGAPGARATLSLGDSVLTTGIFAGDTLNLTFPPFVTAPDTVSLVITAYNKLPYINTISVNPAEYVTASFTASPTTVIPGGYVSFADSSSGYASAWHWSFPGGTPSISSERNPVVYYNTRGVYDVRLVVTNPISTDTLVKSGYITVDFPTAVNVATEENFFMISPNPNNGRFLLTLNSATGELFTIDLYDLVGNKVFSTRSQAATGKSVIAIDVQNAPKGVLFLKVNGDKGTSEVIKVVVSH